jgi:hypothetical protein
LVVRGSLLRNLFSQAFYLPLLIEDDSCDQVELRDGSFLSACFLKASSLTDDLELLCMANYEAKPVRKSWKH